MPLLRPRVITRADVRRITPRGAGSGPPLTEDSFLAKVVKYIPAEIVAAYQSINGAIAAAALGDRSKAMVSIGWIAFVAVVTPIWLAVMTSDRDAAVKPNPVQVWGGLVCFVVWAFALGGPWSVLFDAHWPAAARTLLGSILLAGCTLLIPLAERLLK